MNLAEKLLNDFNTLSEDKKLEVLDFVEFLKQKKEAELDTLMDDVIDNNLEALKELAK